MSERLMLYGPSPGLQACSHARNKIRTNGPPSSQHVGARFMLWQVLLQGMRLTLELKTACSQPFSQSLLMGQMQTSKADSCTEREREREIHRAVLLPRMARESYCHPRVAARQEPERTYLRNAAC